MNLDEFSRTAWGRSNIGLTRGCSHCRVRKICKRPRCGATLWLLGQLLVHAREVRFGSSQCIYFDVSEASVWRQTLWWVALQSVHVPSVGNGSLLYRCWQISWEDASCLRKWRRQRIREQKKSHSPTLQWKIVKTVFHVLHWSVLLSLTR